MNVQLAFNAALLQRLADAWAHGNGRTVVSSIAIAAVYARDTAALS